jgi:hypothetical protein
MGHVVLFVVALVTALLQHGLLATLPVAPDLPLALVAWAVVAGGEVGVLQRAWLVGLARDLVDPGSLCFHTIAYFALALAFLPVRSLIHHGRSAGWMGYAAVSCLVITLADRWLAGIRVWWPLTPLLGVIALTALATLPIGWILMGLPKVIRPIGDVTVQ